MADVHFRVPYGLISPHRYFGVPEVRAREYRGAISMKRRYKIGFDHNIGQAE